MNKAQQSKLLHTTKSNFERRKYLRGLCPCRSDSSEDYGGWYALFQAAKHGSLSERKSAAHSIGTLLDKAKYDPNYRDLLTTYQAELDELMKDPRAASCVLQTQKPHGHARKGSASRNFRKAYSVFSKQSSSDIAVWLNRTLHLVGGQSVSQSTPGVVKLAKWLSRRVKFQPTHRTTEDEMLKKAQHFLPQLFIP
ncbi:MAG: hypothetical protein OXC80_14665 [Gammaproteobacteria bacterium]|nr:hypothetical protein [Gammaproteobacteria bacterium]